MGKTRKLYQVKRLLAMILAVTMVVSMVPAQAYAEESGNYNDITADSPAAAADEEDGGVTTETVETETYADGPAAQSEGDPQVNGDEPATQEDTPPASTAEPVYTIDISNVKTSVVYSGWAVDPYEDLGSVSILKDGERVEDSGWGDLSQTWKKGEAALESAPKDVGTYKLILTYPEKEGVTAEVNLEITQAPLKLSLNKVKVIPGTSAADAAKKVPEISGISQSLGSDYLNSEDFKLTVTGIRNALDNTPVTEDLVKNGDYVMDVKAEFAENADRKPIYDNYKLAAEATADVEMEGLITTQVRITLADKWLEKDEEGNVVADKPVILKEYDEDQADAPKTPDDYTVKVFYWDENAEKGDEANENGKDDPADYRWKELTGAEVEPTWLTEEGQKLDTAPTDAGTYKYQLAYTGKAGVYNSDEESFEVVIEPQTLVVAITNSGKLEFPANTALTTVLSKVTYQVTEKDGTTDKLETLKNDHVWGTSYDDYHNLQIYEPSFTLQVEEEGAWQSIEDGEYRLIGGKKYRVIYDGQKAIYKADGSYAHRTGVNDALNINGVNSNYNTDETPTADDKALEVEAKEGVEVYIDASALLKANGGIGGKTPEEADAKDYDGSDLYDSKSAYKKDVSLKTKVGDTTIDEPLSSFTYEWKRWNGEKYNVNDLLDKEILDENIANEFDPTPVDYFQDPDCWGTMGGIPWSAGIYKLVISYEDRTDGDTFYYAAEPATVYYVINKTKIKIVPDVPEDDYSVLQYRTIIDFFAEHWDWETNRYHIPYKVMTVPAEGEEAKDITSLFSGYYDPFWQVIETETETVEGADPKVTETPYDWNRNDGHNGAWYKCNDTEAHKTYDYVLQAESLVRYDSINIWNPEDIDYWTYFGGYTWVSSEKTHTGEGEKKEAERTDTPLNVDTVKIKVIPEGTIELDIEVDKTKWTAENSEKIYDARPFELDQVIVDGLIKVTEKESKTNAWDDVKDVLEYRCYPEGTFGDEIPDDYWSVPAYDFYAVRDVGSYDLYVCFWGSEKYKDYTSNNKPVKVGTLKIDPRTITLNVDVQEEYTAGVMVNTVINAIRSSVTVENYAPDDEWAFTKRWNDDDYGMPAWSSWDWDLQMPSFKIREKGMTEDADGKLPRNKTYEVYYDTDQGLSDSYYDEVWDEYIDFARNYIVDAKGALAEFSTVPGNGTITSANYRGVSPVRTDDQIDANDSMKHGVTVLEGIGYKKQVSLGADYENKTISGNLVAFKVTVPAEYDRMPATAMYKNDIEKAGGYVVANSSNGFTVLFDAGQFDKGQNAEFKVRWEDGYVETFVLKLGDAVKLADLSKAVAPKSLAFNALNKKMIIGTTQQLDVKITKAQMGDIIYLGYEVTDNTDVLHVTENGLVTALKTGTATVNVYPQYEDADGKAQPIDGVKPLTAKITVTSVSAPKPVKVTAHGTYADLNYATPTTGYRREIYVVKKGSLKKADDFEKAIKNMKNGQWQDTFVVAPIFVDGTDESLSRIDNDCAVRVDGLQVTESYTVYVRNVAAIHTLANGVSVAEDGAAGTVVNFKTKKSEVVGLYAWLDASASGVRRTGYDYNYPVYQLDLADVQKGTVAIQTTGYFMANAKDKYADDNDEIGIALPLTKKTDKAAYDAYENPKLEYTFRVYDEDTDEYKYVQKNDYASIDKKGKIKLTGVTGYDQDGYDADGFYVRVKDTVTGAEAYMYLYIGADADSVVAKKKSINMTVGQRIWLGDMLNYKLGKKKLTAYDPWWIDFDSLKTAVDAKKEWFRLENGGWLTAIKDGGQLELSLTDKGVEQTAGTDKATAKITFKTGVLAPVKNLKAIDVVNDEFGITFTHAGGADSFLVEIYDARSAAIYSKIFDANDVELWNADNYYDTYGEYVGALHHVRVKDTYRINPWDIGITLTKETQYKVEVTALYGGIKSKTASKKVKTTKIPAQDWYISDSDYTGSTNSPARAIPRRGGMCIEVSENNENTYRLGTDWNQRFSRTTLNILSGNSYTLTAEVSNLGRVNDTLVWTVKDGKTASVKAVAGSYAVTLKGLKQGSTVLEVKSKILGNKVIARYDIRVVAVGDAYTLNHRFYGDNEQEDYKDSGLPGGPGSGAITYLPLSVSDWRKVTNRTSYYDYFSFTAPRDGKYQFEAHAGDNCSVSVYLVDYPYSGGNSILNLGWMAKGDTVKLRSKAIPWNSNMVCSSYNVRVVCTESLETVGTGELKLTPDQDGYKWLQFTAPEDGKYTFTGTQILDEETSSPMGLYLYSDLKDAMDAMNNYPAYGSYDKYGSTISDHEMKAGDSVWLATGYLSPDNEYAVKIEKAAAETAP